LASENIQNQIRTAIQAAQSGNKGIARHILEEVVKEAPDSEAAWMWLASVVDTPEERRNCLQRVLAINPDNERAQQALSKLPPEPETAEPGTDFAARLTPAGRAETTSQPDIRAPRPERPSLTTTRTPSTPPVQRPTLIDQRPAAPGGRTAPSGGGQRRGLPPAMFALVAILAIGMI
jgi:hypothetical protein